MEGLERPVVHLRPLLGAFDHCRNLGDAHRAIDGRRFHQRFFTTASCSALHELKQRLLLHEGLIFFSYFFRMFPLKTPVEQSILHLSMIGLYRSPQEHTSYQLMSTPWLQCPKPSLSSLSLAQQPTNITNHLLVAAFIPVWHLFTCLVGGLEHFLFFHILGIIIRTDELIFFRGVGLKPPTSCI